MVAAAQASVPCGSRASLLMSDLSWPSDLAAQFAGTGWAGLQWEEFFLSEVLSAIPSVAVLKLLQ